MGRSPANFRRSILALALGTSTACAISGRAAESAPTAVIVVADYAPSASAAVPKGWLAGRIIDAGTAEPVVGAQIILGQAGVISDSVGLFRIALPTADSVRLTVRRIGYATHEATFRSTSGSGYAALLPLKRSPLRLCGLPITPIWTLAVHVRDALSGVNLARGATLQVRDGSFRESASVRDTLPYLVAVDNRPGIYDLEVWHPGYRSWQATGVRVERGSCGWVDGRAIQVWLVPL